MFLCSKKKSIKLNQMLVCEFSCDDLSPWKSYMETCSDASVEFRIMTKKFRISKFEDKQLLSK